VLLSAFEFLFGYPKKGTILLGYAYMKATELGVFSGDEGQIVNLSKIKRVLVRFTFWSAFQGTIRGLLNVSLLYYYYYY
jgi:hypothetical protein